MAGPAPGATHDRTPTAPRGVGEGEPGGSGDGLGGDVDGALARRAVLFEDVVVAPGCEVLLHLAGRRDGCSPPGNHADWLLSRAATRSRAVAVGRQAAASRPAAARPTKSTCATADPERLAAVQPYMHTCTHMLQVHIVVL